MIIKKVFRANLRHTFKPGNLLIDTNSGRGMVVESKYYCNKDLDINVSVREILLNEFSDEVYSTRHPYEICVAAFNPRSSCSCLNSLIDSFLVIEDMDNMKQALKNSRSGFFNIKLKFHEVVGYQLFPKFSSINVPVHPRSYLCQI